MGIEIPGRSSSVRIRLPSTISVFSGAILNVFGETVYLCKGSRIFQVCRDIVEKIDRVGNVVLFVDLMF